MGESSKIQWTDNTFNGWIGCAKVSPGCAHCYAEVCTRARVLRFNGQETWGKGAKRSRTSEANWKKPLAWERDFQKNSGTVTTRPRVFCSSLSDWLDDEVPADWLADLLNLIWRTPNLDWQLLTKRPENFRKRLIEACKTMHCDPLDVKDHIETWLDGNPWRNVWIGTTVENQEFAAKRIPELLAIPAKVRFLSAEPLLGPVDISPYLSFIDRAACGLEDDPLAACLLQQGIDSGHASAPRMIDWVIIGGESGPGARPFNIEWARSLVQQCKAAEVKPFVKQFGARPFGIADKISFKGNKEKMPDGYYRYLQDKKGGDMAEWPDDLKVREFPV